MATTETARLERETEETRAQLESTLFELRARMSPSSLMDQATDYLRSSSGRAFVGNLRDQVVENPVPVTLIGAGIAWLALSGAMARRGNGNGRAHMRGMERDWGRTGATAYDMAHDGDGRTAYDRGHDGDLRSAVQRAREAADGWTEDARSAASEAGDAMRDGADDLRERAGTMYDETVSRARDTTGAWMDDAREAASEAGDRLRQGMDDMRDGAGRVRDQAAGIYDQTVRGTRRMAGKAADYGRAARQAVRSDGALMNFCREQPMLVAGIGIAIGAALGAMIPASRAEARVMGEASRDVRHRVREAASEGMRAGVRSAAETVEETFGEDSREDGRQSRGPDGNADGGRTNGGGADRASSEVDEGVERASRSPNVESEPQSAAPYAEAAEAGAVSGPGTTETRQPG